MTELFATYIGRFETISLEDLNKTAALLDRQEQKYVLDAERFTALLDDLSQDFYILKIGEHTAFNYKSLYFDSQDLHGYAYHHQGRVKGRFKVRTRHYVESNLYFFEVKLKDKRGGTIKKRLPYTGQDYGVLTTQAREFVRRWYKRVYGRAFDLRLVPQIEVSYQRITLVAKRGGERMTIDFNLTFANQRQTTPVRQMLIVETKTADGRGRGDALMRKYGVRSRSCSKYCLGANLLDYAVKYNRFKPLLKMYDALPVYTPVVVEQPTVPQASPQPLAAAGIA